MQVKEIKKTKSGKYKIKIDDKTITTYDDVILKNRLLNQKELTNESLEQIEIDSQYYDAYYKTVNYIMRKLRSTLEVRSYLEKLDVPENDIDMIIEKLTDIGFINDATYVKAYISDSFYLTNDGPDKIHNYLLCQEIDENLIEDEICKIDKKELKEKVEKLVSKKLKRDRNRPVYQLKQKIVIDMTNLGYSIDIVVEALNNSDIDDSSKLKKEYERLYNKYSKTLNGRDLFKKIKEKLYSRGFDINEINELINSVDLGE